MFSLNLIIFDLHAVVGNFAINLTQNFIGSFFRCLFLFFRLLRLYSLSSEKSELLNDKSDKSSLFCFQLYFFLLRFLLLDFLFFLSSSKSDSSLLLDLLQLLSSNESDLIDDESDDGGSYSGSASTCAFPSRFDNPIGHVDNSVGSVRGVGSGVFFQ